MSIVDFTGGTMAAATSRQITLRLPESLYDQVRQIARKRRVSINRLAQESLESLAREALAEEMRAAYDALASDPEATDVEPFFEAQREVVTREPA
jgi:hypothetical protein